MANIFGQIWRSFLGVPELAPPPDFNKPVGTPPQTQETIPEADEAEEVIDEDLFLYFGQWKMTPLSTNVWGFLYHYHHRALTVGYVGWHNRRDESKLRFYQYYDISEAEASMFFNAGSAGGKVWEVLRREGTVCGHKKEYKFLPGASKYSPKNPCQ